MRAGDGFADPLHSPPVEEGVRPSRLGVVVARNLADVDRRLRLQGQHHEVAFLHLVGEGPDLTDPIQHSLGLGLRVALGHFSGQLASLLQLG